VESTAAALDRQQERLAAVQQRRHCLTTMAMAMTMAVHDAALDCEPSRDQTRAAAAAHRRYCRLVSMR
jgi:hypothetical protein